MFAGSGNQGNGSKQCKESHFHVLSFNSALSGDHDVRVLLSWWGSLDAFCFKTMTLHLLPSPDMSRS